MRLCCIVVVVVGNDWDLELVEKEGRLTLLFARCNPGVEAGPGRELLKEGALPTQTCIHLDEPTNKLTKLMAYKI